MNKTNKITEEELVQEAVKRMKTLGLSDKIIDDFENNNIVSVSSNYRDGLGMTYTAGKKIIRNFIKPAEKTFKFKVYHVITGSSYYGEWLALLFVSKQKDEWPIDEQPFDYNLYREGDKGVLIYGYNLDHPECSEMGTTVVRAAKYGLYRVF